MISLPRFLSLVLAATLVLFGASCEKHSWEETKKLHHLEDEHADKSHDKGDGSHEGDKSH